MTDLDPHLDRPVDRGVDIELLTEAGEAEARDVWAVYEPVFGDHATYEAWWSAVWDRHLTREGFRLALARVDGRVVGFAYGYTGQPRQWWTDQAAQVLTPETAAAWLGGHFELVSLGVLPAHRRRGLGDALMTELTRDLPHDRRVLMTAADPDDPARRLYARHGWVVIGPGLRPDQVILGSTRPTGPA